MSKINIIAAVSSNGVIGKNGTLPFHYPADLQHFKKLTLNSTIVMGRNTFESIGRALPKRRNIIISSKKIDAPNIEVFQSISDFVGEHGVGQDIWLIGGAGIYREGMKLANEIHLTITKDVVDGEGLVYFPWINPMMFKETSRAELVPGYDDLAYVIYSC